MKCKLAWFLTFLTLRLFFLSLLNSYAFQLPKVYCFCPLSVLSLREYILFKILFYQDWGREGKHTCIKTIIILEALSPQIYFTIHTSSFLYDLSLSHSFLGFVFTSLMLVILFLMKRQWMGSFKKVAMQTGMGKYLSVL